MRRLIVTVALALIATVPSAALAHGGNPNYRSIVHGIVPALPGVQVSVLGYDNELQLINKSGEDVTVLGYDGEPYARVLADGTVEQNRNSPATYLNEDRLGETPVPAFASSKKAPDWQVLDKTGRFIWHDHRMHWMGTKNPPQVKNESTKAKIFDYGIPLATAGQKAKVTGTLWWVGPNNSFPILPFALLALLVVITIPVVIRSRRRRAAAVADEPPANLPVAREPREPEHEREPVKEAW